MAVSNPHDKFFKETFSRQENVRDFLQWTFPAEILKGLDLSSLAIDNTSYIDEELKEYFSDIVYNCNCRGNRSKIAILFEHKSYAVEYPHLQLLRYLLKIWEGNIKQGERPVPVIPVIFYHGKEAWKARRFDEYFGEVDGLFHRFIPSFDYLLTDPSTYSNEEIKSRVFTQVSLEIALLLMKNIFSEAELAEGLKDFFEIGRSYLEEEEGLRFLEGAIRYLSKSEIEPEMVIDTIKTVSEKGGEFIMTMESILIERGVEKGRAEGIERGIEKGIEKGIAKGRIQGLQEAIELGLELKYGVKGLKFYETVANITSIERLEVIKEAVKISKSLEEIEVL